jgi:hypothetical protein
MVLHPAIHLEIARQRHQDLLADAELQRITKHADRTEVTPAARRSHRRSGASPSGFGVATCLDLDAGLEP